jgi:Trk K+ transport system NAD-binding subunit
VAAILRDAGEVVHVMDTTPGPGVDLAGDVVDAGVLERSPLATARAVILTLENDSATVFTAAVIRSRARDIPIIAGLQSLDSVAPARRAGIDTAVSLSQVTGQLLAHHVLGETVALRSRVRLARFEAESLIGSDPLRAGIRERTGCTIVAVERGDELLMDFTEPLTMEPGDRLYVCGTADAISAFTREFAASRA